ncbi:hypothetical protein ENH_00021460 [Eimeria necatrix]|uniref:Integrase catalytic domain-containing protein n=1 Tax=Eimeria necatrix TaxID=51315 RepID=U6MTT9_9EIME|nr:hypothetical protein ENH_00021460 [Eimeria necatrix]CDJ66508.1 hypothetical protein ENH_00021460 [Eimeria necatrix]
MGPDYADVALPLVDLTRKDVGFVSTELHTQAVRQLKQRLIDFTTLQVPDTTKPFELYMDASGYAIGAVLEQDGKPTRFLSQVMNRARQRYSIYDQELLALATALDKWSHLLRVSKPYLHIRVHGLWRICVPQFPEFLTHVLHSHPDHVTAGHRGQKKTFAALSKHYYWPGMRAYTTAYVESCTHCRASKYLNQKPAGLLQQLLIPSRRWAHKSFTAADTVELLADRLIRYHGFPEVLISDRDPRIQSDLWNQLCRHFNIKRCMSSSYHPQSNGQTEQVNRTLEQMLRTYIKSDEREWERLLPALELAYNTTSHSSTELSPFEVMIGENPLTAADLDIVGVLAPTLTPPMTKLFRQLCDKAQSHILKAKWQQKFYADTKHRAVEYAVRDKVWLSSKHLPPFRSCPKFEPRYRGPFAVIERIGTVAYRLALPLTYECHNVFHVSQLVPHRPRPPALVPPAADAA